MSERELLTVRQQFGMLFQSVAKYLSARGGTSSCNMIVLTVAVACGVLPPMAIAAMMRRKGNSRMVLVFPRFAASLHVVRRSYRCS